MDAKIHDITAPICMNRGKVNIPRPRALEFDIREVGHDLILGKGNPVKYLSNILTINLHMATHYDLPSTFGYRNLPISHITPQLFVRRAVIVDAYVSPNRVKPLKRKDLNLTPRLEKEFTEAPPNDKPALILRTGMYRHWCRDPDKYMRFPGLSKDLIEWIAGDLEPPIVAIDAISIDRTMEYRTTNMYPYVEEEFLLQVRKQENLSLLNHDVLLRKGILILENIYPETLPHSMSTGLLIAPPIFRFDCRSDCNIHAIPARPLLAEPPPEADELIRILRDVKRMIA